MPLTHTGADNSLYLLGDDLVLRLPNARRDGDQGLQTILIAVSAALAAGVRTPRIVASDDTRELVPVPYVILERVPGEPLSGHDVAARDIPQVWRELGRDLALLHGSVSAEGPAGSLGSQDVMADPRPWLEELAGGGLVSPSEAAWLLRWLDELEPPVRRAAPVAFCHGDLNADNVLVRPGAFEYLAIVDWDAAGWMDPVWDFVPLPLRAAPYILHGYRRVAEIPGDSTAEARLVWHHIQYAIFRWWTLRDQGRGVVERGLGRMRPGVREVLELPGAGWMAHLL